MGIRLVEPDLKDPRMEPIDLWLDTDPGFDPATDAVPFAEMPEIDRYALARYASAALRVINAYEGYEFSSIFQALNTLATVDLSAFYVDVAKDTLYTLAPKSPARCAAQTVQHTIRSGDNLHLIAGCSRTRLPGQLECGCLAPGSIRGLHQRRRRQHTRGDGEGTIECIRPSSRSIIDDDNITRARRSGSTDGHSRADDR